MSQENVEIVRRMWDAFLAGDVQTALSFYAAEVEWDGTNLPDGQIGRGHEAILDHVTRWAAAWDDWTVEVERVVDAGTDTVILFMRERGRSDSGLTMDERHAELYTLRDSTIVRRQGFSDPRQALEAAGLSEGSTSRENVEVVRRIYSEVSIRGRPPAKFFDPGYAVDLTQAAPDLGVIHGVEASEAALGEYRETFDDFRIELTEVIHADETQVVTAVRDGGRLRGSDAEVWNRFFHVWTFRDGKIIGRSSHGERNQALEAAGLSE